MRHLLRILAVGLAIVGFFGAGRQSIAQDLPSPLTLQASECVVAGALVPCDDLVGTPDLAGNYVGRIGRFSLTLSEEYTPDNRKITPYTLTYFYGNGNRNETQGELNIFRSIFSIAKGKL